MSLVLWSIFALAIIFTANTLTASSAATRSRWDWAGFYEQKAGIPLPQELRRPVQLRIQAQERWRVVGGLTGLGLGAVLVLLLGFAEDRGPLVMLTAVLGMACGGAQAILAGQRSLLPDGPRYARSQATEKPDYVPEGFLRAARLGPFAAAATALLAWAVLANAPFGFPNDGEWQGWMVAAWAVLGLLILLWPVAELTARGILRKPQYAGSELELAWDDHCRSEALRSLYTLPIALSGLTCFMAFTAVGLVVTDGSVREGAMDETLYVGLGMFAGTLLLAAAFLVPLLRSLTHRPHQHVLRRLWAGTGFDPRQEQAAA